MDEITKAIDETTNNIVTAINESGLHPRVIELILTNLLSQLYNAQQQQKNEEVTDE